jgi:cold-inducible RNA-binding protein
VPFVSARNYSRKSLGLLPTIPERIILMSAKLWVGNLSHETTSEEIRELFSNAGVVESCQLVEARETGRPKGFAFIEMNSLEAAYAAKEKFNGHDLHGKALKVKGRYQGMSDVTIAAAMMSHNGITLCAR